MSVEVVCGYKLLRALGASALPSYAALDPKRAGADALCVVEQLARDAGVSAEAAAEFLRDAKRLSLAKHANLARVRDVVVGTNTVLLVTEWIDGQTLAELAREAATASTDVPFSVSLRVIVDLLEGLGALHDLRGAKNEPLALAHGEVAPRNLIVAEDGRAVLVHPLRNPRGGAKKPPPDVIGYLAPEVLLGDVTADRRADVYGAGVLLWEALMGRRMHADGEAAGEIVVRLLGSRIETPCAPSGAPWAAGLAEVVKRATTADPAGRYASASEMLAALRTIASSRVAPRAELALLLERVAGEAIRARRERLAPGPKAAPRPVAPPRPSPAVPHEESVIVALDTIPPPSDAPPAEVVEVVEIEVPPDAPSRPALPHSPPPLPVRARPAPAFPPFPAEARVAETSSTDIASVANLIAAPPPRPSRSRAPVVLATACAIIGTAIAISIATSHTDPAPTARAATVPSSASSAPPTPQSRPVVNPREEPSAIPSGLADEIPWPDTTNAKTHAATPNPNPNPSPGSLSASRPEPGVPPTSTSTPSSTSTPTPTPAGPPPRKKPPVYDPMGI